MTNGEQQPGPGGPDPDVLQYLLQSAALPLVAVDLGGRLLYHTKHAGELLEVRPDDIADLNLLTALEDRGRSVLKAHLDSVIIKKQPARCEIELLMPNGRRQWVRLVSHPGKMKSGVAVAWANIENLTQIRHLEKIDALYQRASGLVSRCATLKEFSQSVFDLLRILFGIENGFVASYDRRHDLVRFPFFVDAKDPHPPSRRMAEGLTDYVITTGRLYWLRDQGSSGATHAGIRVLGTVPSDWIGVPIASGGRVVGMTAIQTYEEGVQFSSREVALMVGLGSLFELFMARLEIEKKHEMLSKVAEHADETVVITDLRGIIEYVNPAFERKTGYTREEAVGHSMALINSGKHDEEYYRSMWSEISSGRTWKGRFVNRRKDGTLFEEDASISPIRDEDGEIVHYVGVKRDLGAEGTVDRDGVASRRLDVLERMADSISHDFGNLFMTIRAAADDMQGGKAGDDAARQIAEAVGSGEKLLEQLSSLFDRDDRHAGVVRLNELLIQFEPIARRLVGEKNSIRLELEPRMEAARLNWREVEQVLFSLLMRAARSMGEGGSVEIRTLVAPARKDDAFTFIGDAPSGERKYAVIQVADPGARIPREEWKALFAPGAESDACGLSAVPGIIEQQPGFIGMKENSPDGMIFRLYFPVVRSAPHEPVALTQPKAEVAGGSETVLLAEDDEGARRVMSRMLQDQGYNVLEAENGAMAIRFMLSQKGGIDLLLTDMMMPDFDGHSLFEQSHALQPGMKVVFVSGYSRADLEAEGVIEKDVPIQILKKPFKREELLQLVRDTLDT